MRVAANGIEIELDDQGAPDGEPLLLIMGLGMQLIGWPEELVQVLARRGFRVLRIDNRDAGLSSGFDHLGLPHIGWSALRYALRLPLRPAYGLADMAADALGVLDALGLQRVHLCGASMGGMIAQHLAAQHPERVLSLTLMMTSSGARRLPQPSARVLAALLSRPPGPELGDRVAHFESLLRLIGSPAYPDEAARMRPRLTQMVQRAWHPAGTLRQLLAIAADGDRSGVVRRIVAPTAIIHGEADPLIPVAAAHDLAALIGGATLDTVPGMGHDLPLQLLPRFAETLARNAARAADTLNAREKPPATSASA